MESLQIGHSRLYKLRASYLAARASGAAAAWKPSGSGGNRKGEWAADEQAFLLRALVPPAGAKPYSYAFAASELGTPDSPKQVFFFVCLFVLTRHITLKRIKTFT